jgi:cytochrome b
VNNVSEVAGGISSGQRMLRVWDPAVRLFHWLLVIAVGIDMLLEDGTDLHAAAGYVVLGLVAFRFVWGFIGTPHARFANFVRGPGAIRRYLSSLRSPRPERHLGHNPLGAAMIVALLLVLAVVAGTGALLNTDAYWGSEWLEETHEIAANSLYILIPLHVLGAVAASLLHRENLVWAMVTGRKRTDAPDGRSLSH